MFRLHDLALKGRVAVAGEPTTIAVNSLLGRAYVAHSRLGEVTVIDAHALSALATLPTGPSPCSTVTECGPGLAYDALADRLYAAHLGGVTVFDGGGSPVTTFDTTPMATASTIAGGR